MRTPRARGWCGPSGTSVVRGGGGIAHVSEWGLPESGMREPRARGAVGVAPADEWAAGNVDGTRQ